MGVDFIRCLPAELLAEIFILCLPAPASWTDDPILPTPIPGVSQVSRYWRNISLSTPQLWTTIGLVLDEESFCSYPLDISIIFAGSDDGLDLQPILDILIPHCERWYRFRIHMPWMDSFHKQFMPIRNRLPSLVELDLNLPPFGDPPQLPGTMFEIAPRLRTIFIDSPSYFVLPWAQITHWSSHRWELGIGRCVTILNSTPELVSACFLLDTLITDPIPPGALVPRSSSLTSLTLAVVHQDELPVVLSLLNLPALCQLSISISAPGLPWDRSALTAFLGRSLLIQKLSLNNLNVSTRDLVQILGQTPLLTELTVEIISQYLRKPLNNRFIRSLTIDRLGELNIVPQLTVMNLHGDLQFLDRHLIPMIVSRRGASHGGDRDTFGILNSLCLNYISYHGNSPDASVIARLRTLEHQYDGLQITIARNSTDINQSFAYTM
ncbi:hypothetical protein BD779DRAFT_1523998 [Infundibulicybe gibba]|nr:hypothetical protein BD779DRAFT_1523998 [Infundibulicybe gibba]